jgi:hypothetical protein
MSRLNVPESKLLWLGVLKALGGVGLLVGIAFPLIGVAAAIGLILYFMCAIVTTIRAGWYTHIPIPAIWLSLAIGSLVLRLTLSGAR